MHVFIIAEIGINHNGDLNLAYKLIDAAAAAGCDAVKFQKRTIDKVYSKEMLDSYRESPWGTTQREQKEGLELGEEYDAIDAYCKKNGIEWFASAWDIDSQKFLQKYNLKYNKVASAMLTDYRLLKEVASEKKHTFISTGMSSWEEIDDAVEIFKQAGCSFELMHCVSTYPMDDSDANLAMIPVLRERYGCNVGYSGHEADIFPSVLSVGAGASSLERHITLDKTMYGSDQNASLEPERFAEMVKRVRKAQVVMGSGRRELSEAEQIVKEKLRK